MKKLLLIVLAVVLLTGTVGAVEFWGYPRFNKEGVENGWFEQEVIDAFTAETGIEVTYETIPYNGGPQKVQVAIASGTQPDIILDGDARLLSYGANGNLSPFTLTEEEKSNIYTATQEFSSVDDELFVYPLGSYVSAISVNKDIADKAGYPITDDRDWTISEFETFLGAIKGYCDIPLGFGVMNEQGDDRVRLFMQNFGTDFVEDGKVVLDSDEGIKALEWLKKAQEMGWTSPHPESLRATDILQMYLEGKIGAVIYGGAYFLNPANRDKVNTVNFSNPHPEGTETKSVLSTLGFGAFKSENEDEAKQFIRFFVENYEKEALKMIGWFPVRANTGEIYEDPEFNVLSQFVEYGTYKGTDLAEYQQIRALFYPEMQATFVGMKSPEQALNDFANKANDLLQ